MCPGLDEDLEKVNNGRKTAIIDRELSRLNLDIVALQETRLSSFGSLKEKNFTFFWQGLEPEERRIHGVGFAIRNTLLSSVEPPSQGTERLLSLRIHTPAGYANIICIYAPTLSSSPETKDAFYDQLDKKIKDIPATDELYLLGDFNARVGADQDAWPRCLGHFGIGKQNENGQRLLELCAYYDLCITNTFFVLQPGKETSRFPHALPQTTPRNHLAGPRQERGHSREGRDKEHELHPETEAAALAWPHMSHEGRTHPKRSIVRRARHRNKTTGTPKPPLQRHLQA